MKMKVCRLVAFAFVLASGSTALAQGAGGGFAGIVKDTSGGVLPGVTVEATSPELIEKSRSAVTDDQGAYKIVDLRPGKYTVTFTLEGFATVRREGMELTSNFTAPLSVELKVGGLEETVTVSGQSPVVDTQNTVQQRVFAKAVIEALPVGQSLAAYTALIPGATGTAAEQDVGGTKGENTQGFSIHGSRGADFQQLRDGMQYASLLRAGNVTSSTNPAAVQEVAVETSGFAADAETSGGHINIIPKDGGNVFNGSAKYDVATAKLQGNNITPELVARGAPKPTEIRQQYEIGGGFGGPIKKDKLWFFGSLHYWTTSSYMVGNYYNKRQGTLFYEADLSRPAYDLSYYPEEGIRVTWQAAPKHKITAAYADEKGCNCFWNIQAGIQAPESTGDDAYDPNRRFQGTWSFPATSRLLFWAGATTIDGVILRRFTGGGPDDISVLEQSNNFRYGSAATGLGITTSWGDEGFGQSNANFTTQYVTGSHAVKGGVSFRHGFQNKYSTINHDVSYRFRNQIPNQVTYWATPFRYDLGLDNIALFAQDQWTLKRLTLNLGVRYDGMVGSVPAQHIEAGQYVPERNFEAVNNVPNWKDINARFGVAYDLRGSGKTAVKASLGRYVAFEGAGGIVLSNTPANQMSTSASRTWADTNGDYIPQENELGPLDNANFGKVVKTTDYAADVIQGWGTRSYNWSGLISVQHELAPGVAVNVGYFRTWHGNLTVTDNTLVGAADYSEFCITAPTNSGLPNSGQRICGLYDIAPTQFGRIQNVVKHASDFGTAKDIFNGLDVTLNARLKGGIIVAGGLATGSQMTDYCFTVDSPGTGFRGFNGTVRESGSYQCRIDPAWSAGTQVKLSAVVPLPYAFQVAANWQSLPPIPTTATYTATNAEIAPSLGRNLGACRGLATCTSTANIELIAPGLYFNEPRNNTVDVRLTRTFKFGHMSVQPAFSAYNMLNVGSVIVLNTQYGPQWQNARGVVGPRLMKFNVQVNF